LYQRYRNSGRGSNGNFSCADPLNHAALGEAIEIRADISNEITGSVDCSLAENSLPAVIPAYSAQATNYSE
jgi:hypothetical protein